MARGFFLPNDWKSDPLRKLLKKKVSAVVDHASFTDGGTTAATIDLGFDLPKNIYVVYWNYQVKEGVAVNGAAGETGYNLQLGDGTDADRFNPTTDPAETIGSETLDTKAYVSPMFGAGGSGDGELHVSAAITAPTLTLTLTGGTPDAGNFVHANGAGKFKVEVAYYDLKELFDLAEENA